MNKHAIILPLLITSAVSLHVVSYYIEEPEEIAYNPVETQTVPPTPIEEKPINDGDDKKTVIPIETSKPENEKTSQSVNEVKEKPVEEKEVKEETKEIKTTELVEKVEEAPIQVVSNIIKSKDFNEIIREARINSGRVDPFLSVKPPKMEEIPEVPANLIEEKRTLLAAKIEKDKEDFMENKIAATKKQEIKQNNTNIQQQNSKVKKPIQIPKIVDTSTGKKIVVNNTNNQKEEILVAEAKRISDGIKLTGIVTGTKPLAILSLDNESKVLGIGDEIINNGDKLRIVSIDFNRKSILITDGFYKARLLIEEE